MHLRLFPILILLLHSFTAISQPSVCFGKVAGEKRSFLYPQQQLDTALLLGDYSAFFIGEAQAPSLIPSFRTKFIIHLNETYGIRDVFLEAGYATAWMLNQFLLTGDRSEFLPEGDIYSEWKQLYDYNQSIPRHKRLIIHGLDFERRNVFRVLLLLRPQQRKTPPELEPFFASLKDATSDTTLKMFSKAFASKWRSVRQYFTEHEESLAAYYGEAMETLRPIIRNDATQSPNVVRRNNIMANNLIRTLNERKIDKFVAVFGGAHTQFSTRSAIPNQIKQLPLFRDKTLSVALLLHNVDPAYNGTPWPYLGIAGNEDNPALFRRFVPADCRAVAVQSRYTGEKNLQKNCDWVWMADEAD